MGEEKIANQLVDDPAKNPENINTNFPGKLFTHMEKKSVIKAISPLNSD
jgi:hypothetical protein